MTATHAPFARRPSKRSRLGERARILGFAAAALLAITPARGDAIDTYLFADDARLRSAVETGLPEAPRRYWLEDPEFRFVPDRNTEDTATETYRVRFRPTTIRERNADRAMYRVENEIVTAKWRQSTSEALAGRYHRLLELLELQLEADLLHKRLVLDRDLIAAEEALAAGSDFSAARLRSATARLDEHQQALERGAAKALALRHTMQLAELAAPELAEPRLERWLLQPAAIGQQLAQLVADAPGTAFDSVVPRLAVERAQHRLAEEQGRSGLGLSLFELSYQHDRIESYTLTFGFRIPFAQRPNTSARLQRDVFEAEQLAQLAERELAETVRYAAMELRLQVDTYAQDAAALVALRRRSASAAADAAAYAALRAQELDLTESMNRTHIQALRVFVDLLAQTAQLDRAPLRNWLRADA